VNRGARPSRLRTDIGERRGNALHEGKASAESRHFGTHFRSHALAQLDTLTRSDSSFVSALG
jgi:hypothetical protein